MDSQKFENILNLALDTPAEERGHSVFLIVTAERSRGIYTL